MAHRILLAASALLAVMLVSACATRSSAANTTPQRCSKSDWQQIQRKLTPSINQFSDEDQVATSTPRVSLAPIITELQSTHRTYEALPYPHCYEDVRKHNLNAMDFATQSLIAFLGQQSDTTVSDYSRLSAQEIQTATSELTAITPR